MPCRHGLALVVVAGTERAAGVIRDVEFHGRRGTGQFGSSMAVKYRILATVLSWLAVVLILRVLVTILANYPDYFPPNFDSLFLQGREATFRGAYRAAFYIHIFSAPLVLFNGLILLSEYVRRRHRGWHRWLGRVQVVVLLLFVLPSSVVMSRHAFGGWPAGLSFLLLSAATASCAIVGVVYARRRRYDQHRRWMLRCLCLDLFGGGPSSDLGDGGAGRGAESRARVHLRGLEQLAVPAGGLRDRGALASASAVPTPRLVFAMRARRGEAFCNAIKHGNRLDRDKKVQAYYRVLADRQPGVQLFAVQAIRSRRQVSS